MADDRTKLSRWRDAVAAAGFVGVCFMAAAVGQWFGRVGPDEWYRSLRMPAFTPPSWMFGPVWTVLYVCMGVAAWLVWRGRGFRGAARPLACFALQLALNAAWTVLFFGLHSPGWALADIAALWVAIALTAAAFRPISRPAAWLMAPYLAWVTFAAALNLAIWRLNG